MKALPTKLVVGLCALQMGCSGDADPAAATDTGGLSNSIGGNTAVALGGTSNVLGGTSGTGGVTSAPAGGALGTGGITSTFTTASSTRASCGASLCASGEKCCDASCGMCSVNNLCPAAVCPTGGTGSTGGSASSAATSSTRPTGGTTATGTTNVTGGKPTTGGVSAGSSAISGGSIGTTGGVATGGGSLASGGTSQVGTASCSDITSATECDAKAGCHSVYQNPRNCLCAARGCCATFSHCADGEKAQCATQAVECDMAEPYCEDPDYVVSYTRNCYEGCVKPADCETSGVCGSNCTFSTALTAPVCTAGGKLLLTCAQPYPGDLTEIMNRNGCTDAGLSSSAFCCPPAIQTQCL